MKLTEDQVTTMLAEATPSIVESLKAELRQSMLEGLRSDVADQVRTTVTEWCAENLVPEIEEALSSNKDSLVSSAVKCAGTISEMLSEAMVTQMADSLKESYGRHKVFKAMFGDY